MNWEYWLTNYGYAAVLVGTFLEGESILVLAGFAANRGYLTLPLVIAAAFAGSFSGDQLFFFIGRRHGRRILERFPRWHARVMRVHQLMERWHTIFILGFRFLYGLRTISPFVLGTSDVRTRRFFFLNMIGAAVWAVAIGCGGYAFGEVLEMAIGHAKKYEKFIFIGALVVVLVVSLVFHLRARKRDARAEPGLPPADGSQPLGGPPKTTAPHAPEVLSPKSGPSEGL